MSLREGGVGQLGFYLIVNADDCGYSPGINRGIVFAFRRGIVSSTTIMVNQPYCKQAVKLLRRAGGPAAGIHLNLTRGRPLCGASVPSLVDTDGYFFQGPEAFYRQQIDASQVLQELEAQVEKAASLGVTPTHLDAHHHMQSHPAVREAMIKIAGRCGLPLRHFWEEDKRDFRRAGIATPDLFIGSFWDEQATVENLCSLLREAASRYSGGCVELMTHPGYPDAAAESAYDHRRLQELQALCAPAVRELLDELAVELVDYSHLRC